MSKSWGKVKKELEQEWICASCRGHITYFLTSYRKAHDQRGRIAILIDGVEVHQTSDLETEIKNYNLWSRDSLDAMLRASSQGMIHQRMFFDAYQKYCSSSIEENILSLDALIRLFTIFDRRIGKERFRSLKKLLVKNDTWLQKFYDFRYQAEN